MPLYEYGPKSGRCARCKGSFEVMQRLSEPKLKSCPKCGKPVERLLSAVGVHTKYALSKSRLSDAGLTQYRKTSDGSYERTAGHKGPKLIRKPED